MKHLTLQYVTELLYNRNWTWLQDYSLKYLDIKVDTRDNTCVLVSQRTGKVIASTTEELDSLFNALNEDQKEGNLMSFSWMYDQYMEMKVNGKKKSSG